MRRKAAGIDNKLGAAAKDHPRQPSENDDDDSPEEKAKAKAKAKTTDPVFVVASRPKQKQKHSATVTSTPLFVGGGRWKSDGRSVQTIGYSSMSRRTQRSSPSIAAIFVDIVMAPYYPFLVLACLACLLLHAIVIHTILPSMTTIDSKLLPRQVILPHDTLVKIPYHLLRTSLSSSYYNNHLEQMPLLFPNIMPGPNYLGNGIFYRTWAIDDDVFVNSKDTKEFGNIAAELRFLQEDGERRVIYRSGSNSGDNVGEYDDDYDNWFAYDDDWERSSHHDLTDDKIVKEELSVCRRPSWYMFQAPICNVLHELDVVFSMEKFIGYGSFRDVFEARYNYLNITESVAFKESRYERNLDYQDMEFIRIDSLVAERFTSHPRFANMYAYCGFSQVAELFRYSDIENDIVRFQRRNRLFNPLREHDLRPRNKFTPSEKLHLALEMVEPLVAMHTAPGGVIVHDDVDLGQYLWADGQKQTMKLNDFNRAEILLYDEKNQEYCAWKNGPGKGSWRSPEEYLDRPLGPKIDVWSVGNNIYSLLTGLFPFYDIEDVEDVQNAVKDGQRPTIDPRYRTNSYAESQLVEIIEKCHIYEPRLRPNMTDIQQMLRKAIEEDQRLKESSTADGTQTERKKYQGPQYSVPGEVEEAKEEVKDEVDYNREEEEDYSEQGTNAAQTESPTDVDNPRSDDVDDRYRF